MKTINFISLLICRSILLLTISNMAFTGCCKKDVVPDAKVSTTDTSAWKRGWVSSEPYSQTIPVAVNYGAVNSATNLPSKIDLTPYFPPIQNQYPLGTCVAWATAYNTKTYLDGVSKKLSAGQLQNNSNQYSPTDLFFSIDQSKRDCYRGTNFDDAFGVLINRGVNTLANVPYDGQCRPYSPGNSSSASQNRIKSYRRIEGSISEIKQYLSQGIPVVMGAMVDDDFSRYRGNSVINYLSYSGEVGGHAMVVAGYDDSKGAFRIINSWGTTWGDNGYAWVGYDFFVNKFCIQGGKRSLFIAFNDNPTTLPTQTTTTNNTPDMTAIVSSDFTGYPSMSPSTNARQAYFDVKNIGNQTIYASSRWNIYYLWVNAFDANNYGIIFRGEFTDAIPKNTYQNINANYSKINFDIPSGSSLAQVTFSSSQVSWGYFMPVITGNYYLVLYIDKGQSNEQNATNNVFYVTQSPKFFNNGYSQRSSNSGLLPEVKYKFEPLGEFNFKLTPSVSDDEASLNSYRKLSTEEFPNSYSSDEIVSFLKYKISNGGL